MKISNSRAVFLIAIIIGCSIFNGLIVSTDLWPLIALGLAGAMWAGWTLGSEW